MTDFNRAISDVAGMIDGAIARSAAATIDLPHVVYVYDRLLGLPYVLGPFPTPIDASAYAERFVREVVGANGDLDSLRVDVVALEAVESWVTSRSRYSPRRLRRVLSPLVLSFRWRRTATRRKQSRRREREHDVRALT